MTDARLSEAALETGASATPDARLSEAALGALTAQTPLACFSETAFEVLAPAFQRDLSAVGLEALADRAREWRLSSSALEVAVAQPRRRGWGNLF